MGSTLKGKNLLLEEQILKGDTKRENCRMTKSKIISIYPIHTVYCFSVYYKYFGFLVVADYYSLGS